MTYCEKVIIAFIKKELKIQKLLFDKFPQHVFKLIKEQVELKMYGISVLQLKT